ncbi:hypothetical protein BCY91_14095 [Pelobium manganitolerans]|uniref:Uncharacterized protein n=1 Tax=Pelobium manganitolerans TaxID=1842495 RepID=A0A419SAC1_9SPHI|nr:hypothetical protein [Pelobium manganitolerans]RKD19004.1 hypothetical protein BCY91_14095 [Pelobium manganitolerans]
MIPARFTFFGPDDKPYHKEISIPTNWGDLTLGQMLTISELKEQKNYKIKLLSIITGFTDDELSGATDLEQWKEIELLLSFLTETPDLKAYPLPNKIKIDNEEYKIPIDLKVETFGQKVALEELAKNLDPDNVNFISLMPEALAIYFYPRITGERFNDERVEDFVEIMRTIPVKQAFPVASFFLSSYVISAS